jgi:hypothetical protein
MRLLDLYYFAKPAIPQALRLRVRRMVATHQRRRFADTWPIDVNSSRAPDGWPGWPERKRFAFALTHDVEGERGLRRCRALAEIEMQLGFRSSFNFVPEGEYRAPNELFAYLREHQFEIGVHDLHHDGTLYRSRRTFRDQMPRINHYLASWNAVGFRAGFMFHNLEWLQELDVLYDASTFDTDPFEPQPEGVATIFPFWVARPDGTGYVELPYTLPQDSTLFLVLGDNTIDVWKKKLDWVAAHGGMALVNVHPDYIDFEGKRRATEYPVDLYKDLLMYVRERYRDEGWFALPRQVARHMRQVAGSPPKTSAVMPATAAANARP